MRRAAPKTRQFDRAAPAAFFITTAVGVCYILSAKSLGYSPVQVTTIPCVLMFLYAGLLVVGKRWRLRDDQSGDNFYYMGFIFTLTSLAMSLYQFASNVSVDEIIRNFGVAVASTIVGIALRIAFNQMRRDPVEVEHYSRLDLAEASNRVRRELDGVLLELAHFRRTNQEMLSEGFHEIRSEVQRTTQETLKSMSEMATEALQAVRTTNTSISSEVQATNLKGELDQTTKNLKRIATALAKAGDQIERASSSFTDRLDQFSPPDRVLEVKLEPTIDALEAAIRGLGASLERQAHVIGEQTAAIASLQSGLGASLGHQTTAMSNLQEEITQAVGRMEKTLGHLVVIPDDPSPPRRGLFGLFRAGEPSEGRASDEKPGTPNS